MATAPPTAAAPATMTAARRTALRRALPAAATIVAVAVALKLLYDPWYMNYDARYSLVWARDIWHGFLPEFKADFAPTPHPLSVLAGMLAVPLGDQVMVWIVLLSFGALIWLTFRLGSVLFSPWVGAVAAVVVLTRPVLERDVLLAYQDVPFAALIVGAVLLEAQQRRRGVPVLALLTLAGLLRPEAWVLAGLYFLWLWPSLAPRRRVLLAGLTAVAPVIWALIDWIVTGDPLHSLHGTAALAEEVDRRRRVDQVPYWSIKYFGFTLREPLLLGIPIGLAFAWRHRRREGLLPFAIVVAMTLVFAIGPIFGLPLIARYIRTPAVLLCLFFGLAVAGWHLLPKGRERNVWIAGALATVALFLAFLPENVTMLSGLRLRSEREGRLYGDLRAVGESSKVRAAFAKCAPLTAADHRPIPYIRWWLDGDPGSVGTVESGASPLGKLLLVPRADGPPKRFYKFNFPKDVKPPARYSKVYENRSWRVFGAPGCG
jgi:hypothetical protein